MNFDTKDLDRNGRCESVFSEALTVWYEITYI